MFRKNSSRKDSLHGNSSFNLGISTPIAAGKGGIPQGRVLAPSAAAEALRRHSLDQAGAQAVANFPSPDSRQRRGSSSSNGRSFSMTSADGYRQVPARTSSLTRNSQYTQQGQNGQRANSLTRVTTTVRQDQTGRTMSLTTTTVRRLGSFEVTTQRETDLRPSNYQRGSSYSQQMKHQPPAHYAESITSFDTELASVQEEPEWPSFAGKHHQVPQQVRSPRQSRIVDNAASTSNAPLEAPVRSKSAIRERGSSISSNESRRHRVSFAGPKRDTRYSYSSYDDEEDSAAQEPAETEPLTASQRALAAASLVRSNSSFLKNSPKKPAPQYTDRKVQTTQTQPKRVSVPVQSSPLNQGRLSVTGFAKSLAQQRSYNNLKESERKNASAESINSASVQMDTPKQKEKTLSVKEPAVKQPVVETTVVETTAVEEAAVEEQAVEESAVQEPAVEEQAVEESAVQEPVVEEPTVEQPTETEKEQVEQQEEKQVEKQVEKAPKIALEKPEPDGPKVKVDSPAVEKTVSKPPASKSGQTEKKLEPVPVLEEKSRESTPNSIAATAAAVMAANPEDIPSGATSAYSTAQSSIVTVNSSAVAAAKTVQRAPKIKPSPSAAAKLASAAASLSSKRMANSKTTEAEQTKATANSIRTKAMQQISLHNEAQRRVQERLSTPPVLAEGGSSRSSPTPVKSQQRSKTAFVITRKQPPSVSSSTHATPEPVKPQSQPAPAPESEEEDEGETTEHYYRTLLDSFQKKIDVDDLSSLDSGTSFERSRPAAATPSGTPRAQSGTRTVSTPNSSRGYSLRTPDSRSQGTQITQQSQSARKPAPERTLRGRILSQEFRSRLQDSDSEDDRPRFLSSRPKAQREEQHTRTQSHTNKIGFKDLFSLDTDARDVLPGRKASAAPTFATTESAATASEAPKKKKNIFKRLFHIH